MMLLAVFMTCIFLSFLHTTMLYIKRCFPFKGRHHVGCALLSESGNEAEIVLDIDRDAGCCRVALDENPLVELAVI